METNTLQTESTQAYQLEFKGQGAEFFGILIVNWILTAVTLGFYYPWARVKQLQYMYSHTTLNNESFHFSGTGAELFKGFIKLVGFYILLMIIAFIMIQIHPILALLTVYLVVFAIVPFVLHSSLRYHMSRTSYRGIRFGYRGDRKELTLQFFKDAFLTIITFGIYGSWLAMNLRSYTHRHFRYGNVSFSNEAKGADYFILNLKGTLLTAITFGIYAFWWQKDIFNYYIDNMKLEQGEHKVQFSSSATGGAFFKLLFVNVLLLIFTLGIAAAWIEMRTMRFIFSHIHLSGDIDLSAISQTEEEYKDALGEDAMDFLNIDIV
ncbi:MAG: hypothetical protein RL751_269 [Bacteroidota bacterium]|jgi:uncharacterized membrane protein YjgN (DUF898 family)